MTPPSVPQQQPAEDPSGTSDGQPDPPAMPVDSRRAAVVRRGRKPDPVSDKAGPCHQAWLHPVRGRISASGLTLDQLVSLTNYSKTRISTLLRGAEYYPGWEITYSVVHALDLPVWPLRRLWTAGAREADKDQAWIEERIHEVRVWPSTSGKPTSTPHSTPAYAPRPISSPKQRSGCGRRS
ncbi:hypothetical protein [Streptomyces sp. NBC_00258]|uniref:hypothetical protein n=1 Tax=Streptomyces sp. NBC_00258 TaxID=2903642 RepID=UPI002E2D2588|nr:hypothetical protein [Streptomyces sp. NBC_00258]